MTDWSKRVEEYADVLKSNLENSLNHRHDAFAKSVSQLPVLKERVDNLINDFKAKYDKLTSIEIVSAEENDSLSEIEQHISALQSLVEIENMTARFYLDRNLESLAQTSLDISSKFEQAKLCFQDNSSPFLSTLDKNVKLCRGKVIGESVSIITSALVLATDSVTIAQPPQLDAAWKALAIIECSHSAETALAEKLKPFLSTLFLSIPPSADKVDCEAVSEKSVKFTLLDNPHRRVMPDSKPRLEAVTESLVLLFELLCMFIPQGSRACVGRRLWVDFLAPRFARDFAPSDLGAKAERALEKFGFLTSALPLSAGPPAEPALRAKAFGQLRRILLDPKHNGILLRIDNSENFQELKTILINPDALPPVISAAVAAVVEFLPHSPPLSLGLVSAVRRAQPRPTPRAHAILANDLFFLSAWAAVHAELYDLVSLRRSADEISRSYLSESAESLRAALAKALTVGGVSAEVGVAEFLSRARDFHAELEGLVSPRVLIYWTSEFLGSSLELLKERALGRPGLEIAELLSRVCMQLPASESLLSDLRLLEAILTCTPAQLIKFSEAHRPILPENIINSLPGLMRANPKLASLIDTQHLLRLLRCTYFLFCFFLNKMFSSIARVFGLAKSDDRFKCDVFVQEGGCMWELLSEEGVKLDKVKGLLTVEDREVSLSEVCNLSRFADPENPKITCFQFIAGEVEWGLKFPGDPELFAEAMTCLTRQGARVIAEVVGGAFLELQGAEWETVADSPDLEILVSQRDSDFESFLTVRLGASILFQSTVSRSLNFNFRKPLISFYGSSPLSPVARFLALRVTTAQFPTLEKAVDCALRSRAKRAPVAAVEPSYDTFESESSDESGWDSDSSAEAKLSTGKNKLLAVGKKSDRTFVVSGGGSSKAVVHALKADGKVLQSAGQVTSSFLRKDGKTLANPRSAMLHQGDSKLLCLEGKSDILSLDLETGKVVNEWKGPAEQSIASTFPRSKFAQATDEQTFLAVNDRSLIVMDPRISGDSQAARTFKYATNVKLSCVASDEQGRIAVGSKTGQIRLFDGEANRDGDLKRAKSLLDGFGDPVNHVEVSADGKWLLATCGGYIALLGLSVGDVTGFTKSLSGEPSSVANLTISGTDLAQHGVQRLNFSPARFTETLVVSSVGSVAVSWDLAAAKRGKNKYTLKKLHSNILDADSLADHSAVVTLFSGGVGIASRRH